MIVMTDERDDDEQAAIDAAVARSLAAARRVLGEWARDLDNGIGL